MTMVPTHSAPKLKIQKERWEEIALSFRVNQSRRFNFPNQKLQVKGKPFIAVSHLSHTKIKLIFYREVPTVTSHNLTMVQVDVT